MRRKFIIRILSLDRILKICRNMFQSIKICSYSYLRSCNYKKNIGFSSFIKNHGSCFASTSALSSSKKLRICTEKTFTNYLFPQFLVWVQKISETYSISNLLMRRREQKNFNSLFWNFFANLMETQYKLKCGGKTWHQIDPSTLDFSLLN